MSYDFENLRASYPENNIVVEVGKEQQENGIPEEEILKQSLEFVNRQVSDYFQLLIKTHNDQVYSNIKSLAIHDDWVSLRGIAKHALEIAQNVIEGEITKEKERAERKSKDYESGIMDDIIDLFKLQNEILNTSISQLGEKINQKWLRENYPRLVRDLKN
jgi:N-acetylglutamate synthase-like GNAT family acetyltransferase